MTAIYGLYDTPETVQIAVNSLRRAGVADRDITVISSEPFEEHEFSHRDKASWLFHIACAGGVFGLAFGTFLTVTTERAWPINTGGMPIVALWPNLVVTFELTMLCAILATVISLLVTAELPSRTSGLYDLEISNGKILVGVEPAAGSSDSVRRVFDETGALVVKTAELRG
jgi:hypothetical protein